MKSITVFVMLDACRHDYITKITAPFLSSLGSQGFFGLVKPTFGFEPDAAYLAGLYPDQANGGAQFWYAPEESPFPSASVMPMFLNNLPVFPQKVIRKLIEKAVRRTCTSPNLSTAKIPFHRLENFALPMKFGLDHPQFCPNTQTVFDLLRSEGKRFLFHAAPDFKVSVNAACLRAEKEMTSQNSFAFFHIGNLDGVGHAYGPQSSEIKKELIQVDEGLERIYNTAKGRFDTVHFVVMGDHGMVEVSRTINVEAVLKPLDLSDRDYMYLLDSTMARFWFFSDRAKDLVRHSLSFVQGGHVLNQTEKDIYHLNYSHNRFGDFIFLADPGCLIIPNHYQGHAPVKGMHGYSPDTYGQQAALIIGSNKTVRQTASGVIDMRQVFPTVCDLLGITVPPDCSAESLVEK